MQLHFTTHTQILEEIRVIETLTNFKEANKQRAFIVYEKGIKKKTRKKSCFQNREEKKNNKN